MKDIEMIEEIDKQRERRINYCVRIQEAFNYKGNYDHEDIPSILVDFEKEIKYEILPKDSVVLSREEYEKLKAENDKYVKDCIDYIATINKLENKVWEVEQQASKETAQTVLEEFICKLVNARLVSTREDLYYELLEAKDDLLKEKYGAR